MNRFAKKAINSILDKYTLGNIAGMGYQVPDLETPLCKIAFKYQVDKCEKIKHPFTQVYYDLLGSQRRSVRKVLEIGAGSNKPGASLYMWKDFFPFAQIYGTVVSQQEVFRDGRIKTAFTDQSKKRDLANLIATTGADIDLLIYDGSHLPQDQVSTCLTLMPLVHKEVIYVIEDVADLAIEKRLRQFDTHLISLRGSNGRRYRDDKLLVVRNMASWA